MRSPSKAAIASSACAGRADHRHGGRGERLHRNPSFALHPRASGVRRRQLLLARGLARPTSRSKHARPPFSEGYRSAPGRRGFRSEPPPALPLSPPDVQRAEDSAPTGARQNHSPTAEVTNPSQPGYPVASTRRLAPNQPADAERLPSITNPHQVQRGRAQSVDQRRQELGQVEISPRSTGQASAAISRTSPPRRRRPSAPQEPVQREQRASARRPAESPQKRRHDKPLAVITKTTAIVLPCRIPLRSGPKDGRGGAFCQQSRQAAGRLPLPCFTTIDGGHDGGKGAYVPPAADAMSRRA